ncbi:VWA domain-containing protein [Psychrobacter sp. I-STPA10]|uniref:VWA domain-containing protein n=1 Tax=Psychrobacter sp. I-STPA10 TaxID=2585769 RepID=UPI001E5C6592|nr:VWA domain-containing protein [Psychrobacter sp. I-STPA10]
MTLSAPQPIATTKSQNSDDDQPPLSIQDRWRLLLGEVCDSSFGQNQNSTVSQMNQHLTWLYGREQAGLGLNTGNGVGGSDSNQEQLQRQVGQGASTLSTPEWINNIEVLFPKQTVERLQKDALELYQLDDLVTCPEVLQRATPNPTLLSAVLRTKHLMNPEVLAMARKLVKQVVEELLNKLKLDIERSTLGKREPVQLKKQGSSKQLAFKATIKRNLQHYDPKRRQLILAQPWFYSHHSPSLKEWQLIILVDQSGSMVDSVIHSAIVAASFWGIRRLRTHLIAFDTNVVDLTDEVQDPVELLMQVQLGGGTNIANAVQYASELITIPKRTMVVLISDFYEGGNEAWLVQQIAQLHTQGSKVLALAALDENANPSYCHDTAQQLAKAGASVAAMTPAKLADWVIEVMG